MLRIVGVQRSDNPKEEFILIQNQGSLRVGLRGHAILSDAADTMPAWDATRLYAFTLDEKVFSGGFVLLSTGCGTDRWAKTTDGSQVLRVFANRSEPLWSDHPGSLILLAPQHVYPERPFITPCTQFGEKIIS